MNILAFILKANILELGGEVPGRLIGDSEERRVENR